MKIIKILLPFVAFISAGGCFNLGPGKEQLIQTIENQRRIIEIQSSQILASKNIILCHDGLLVA